jgi:Ca2+-binding RTX toxin-like protein
MQFPSRRARIALLAGCATLGIAGTASAATTSTAVYDTQTNVLSIAVSGTGTDELTCDPATKKVKFNGANPTRIPDDGKPDTGCAASVGLKVDEADKVTATDNTLDLRGVTRSDWTGLAGGANNIAITMGGGPDTVEGTEFADSITPGDAADVVHGNAGNDTMIWNPGEDNDVMNGEAGVDTVIDNGVPTVDETFVVKPKDGDASRVDVTRTIPAAGIFTLDIEAENLTVDGKGGNDTITGQTGLAGLVKTTMLGGDGNDVLTGTDGDDIQKGGPGNDTLAGAKGNDNMAGDEDNDLLIWNPGEGSDTFEGGAGNDIGQDNGGNAAEHFVVSANGARVTATRDNGAPFFLDMNAIETLDLNANGGDDSVDVNNGLGALIKVDANLGEGNDSIKARNDSAQIIDGAGGTDTAQVDATDTVANVENVDAPAGADRKAPKVTLAAKSAKVKRGRAAVKVRCPKGESVCKGTLRILRKGKVVGKIAINIPGGKTKVYNVKISNKTLVALAKAKGKKLRVTLKVTAKDKAGNTGKSTAPLTIKR